MNRFNVLLVLFSFFVLEGNAQSKIITKDNQIVIDQIKNELKRIDQMDGVFDNMLTPEGENDQWLLYYDVYFDKVDSFVHRVVDANMYNWQKKNLLFGMKLTLQEINARNYKQPLYYSKLFDNAFGMIGAVEHKDLTSFLITDPVYSVKNIYFYKFEQEAKGFLTHVAATYPDEVLKVFGKFQDRPYRDTIVEVCAIIAPNVTKNYLIGETPIKNILKNNTHPSVMGMRGFFAQYNILSKGMVLVDDIVAGEMTIQEANSISQNKRQFLRKMIEIRNQDYAMALYSLDQELKISSLEYVREINDLHNEPNPKIRFKSIDDFNWKELYTMMVYGEEEIFTSSFNGAYERLVFRLKESKLSGWKMIDSLRFNKFRTFIKLCAGYGKLNDFLGSMSKEQSRELIKRFTQDLEKTGELTSAINVADAFGSIKDSMVQKEIENNINVEYERVVCDSSKTGLAIYGLLRSLFVNNKNKDTSWYNNVAERYKLERLDYIENDKLMGLNNVHNQIHFFYDDEDGEASFSSFISTFKTPNYKLIEREKYIIIESIKGKKVRIYANKPKSELDGQADLIAIMDSLKRDIKVMVHRGHSYYAMNTIEQIPVTTKIVFLGSCGSYNNVREVLSRTQNVHIISSKQIGTMAVNNPLLFIIAETVREGKNIYWPNVWIKLENTISKSTYAMEKFEDYVPPHKNLGAIFLQAYTNLVSK